MPREPIDVLKDLIAKDQIRRTTAMRGGMGYLSGVFVTAEGAKTLRDMNVTVTEIGEEAKVAYPNFIFGDHRFKVQWGKPYEPDPHCLRTVCGDAAVHFIKTAKRVPEREIVSSDPQRDARDTFAMFVRSGDIKYADGRLASSLMATPVAAAALEAQHNIRFTELPDVHPNILAEHTKDYDFDGHTHLLHPTSIEKNGGSVREWLASARMEELSEKPRGR